MDYNDKNIAVISIMCSSLSMFSCFGIIILYQKFKSIQSANNNIVMQILYFDLGFSFLGLLIAILYLIDWNLNEAISANMYWCNTQAFLTNYSIMGCQFSTALACLSLYRDIVGSSTMIEPFWYKLIRYILPIILSLMPVITDSFGPQPLMELSNCFFANKTTKIYCYYIPQYICFAINLIVMSMVVIKLKNISNFSAIKLISLFLYPAILFLCWVLVNKQINQEPDILIQVNVNSGYTYQIIGLLMGTFDSCIYGFNVLRHQLTFENGRIKLKSSETTSELTTVDLSQSQTRY